MATSPATQRFKTTDILRMFPSFVWKGELGRDVTESINAALLAALAEIGAPLDLAHRESWQSPHDLHERAPFAALAPYIHAAAASALARLKIARSDMVVTGCWANLNAPGAGHPEHSHPNNYLSGVYYVRTPAGADTIAFHDPRPQAAIMRPPVTALTADNADEVMVRVREGMLLLFPAWLPHSVEANASTELRISISFNLMFAAYAETMGRPLWEPGIRSPNH